MMAESEAWFTTTSTVDPYTIVGVERDASPTDIKRAFRLRARALHPDVCGDDDSAARFCALVEAYHRLQRLEPGSMETHPCWDQLPDFYHHWARELGHLTAEGLEEWISMLGLYDDEDLMLTNLAHVTPLEGAEENPREGAEEGAEEGAKEATEPATEPATEEVEKSAIGLLEIMGHRVYLGNEQWQVRWAAEQVGDVAGLTVTSWERFTVLDTDALRTDAKRWRAAATRTDV